MTNVLLEKKGHIAIATINRPKALNALNSDVLTLSLISALWSSPAAVKRPSWPALISAR